MNNEPDDKMVRAFRRAVMLSRRSDDIGVRRAAESIFQQSLREAVVEFATLHPELERWQIELIASLWEAKETMALDQS